jgi:hypothetical protein
MVMVMGNGNRRVKKKMEEKVKKIRARSLILIEMVANSLPRGKFSLDACGRSTLHMNSKQRHSFAEGQNFILPTKIAHYGDG